MLESEPNDSFLLYALAMELRKEGSIEEATVQFEKLMKQDVPHVPAFFMCGQMYAEAGEIEQARTYLRDGIDEARRQGNAHAAGEMAELLSALGSLGE